MNVATNRSAESIVVQTAWLYYHDGWNQTDIAEHLSVSRASVVNYLNRAREQGLIRVTLSDEVFTGHRLAEALCERFGLQGAYVLPAGSADSEEQVFLRVAQGAALWLPRLLGAGDRLGVSWGRTVFELAQALDSVAVPELIVTQLVGSMSTPYGFTAETCSTIVAQKLSATCINLHAPAVLSDAKLATRLRREPIIKAQLDALARCNKAIFAAGSCTPDSHIVGSGVATRAELEKALAAGAVGVLCGRFIDAAGQEIGGDLSRRIMGVSLADLCGLDVGLVIASGAERVAAMHASIRGGYATHAVTCSLTAEALLDAAS